MATQTDSQDNIHWSEVLRNNAAFASKALEAANEACPDPGEVKGMTTDQYALQAAKAQGWREAVSYIFKEYPTMRFASMESPFIDTTLEQDKE